MELMTNQTEASLPAAAIGAMFRLLDAVGLALAGNQFELGRDPLFAAYKEVKSLDLLGALLAIKAERERAERAEQDARRYRWLRDVCLTMDAAADPDNLVRVWWGTDPAKSAAGLNLDSAVDRAIAQEQPK